MTRQEAINFLKNKKVYVKDKSEEIQKKLFEIGFVWTNKPMQNVKNIVKPFIYIYDNMQLRYGSDVNWFYGHPNWEITAEDILSITIDELKYRPFKDKDECWNEMLKHHPFGWTKHKEKQFYKNWICVDNNGIDETSFYDAYKNYAFADGSPFGIKKD